VAFDREENVTKTAIGDFEIKIFDPVSPDDDNPQTDIVEAQLVMSDNSRQKPIILDLLDRLSSDPIGRAHLANMASLRAHVRTLLENEVVPT